MLYLSRRSFLRSFVAALAAPAIVKFELLMPVKALVVPETVPLGLQVLSRYIQLDPQITLDQYTERVLGPMVRRLQQIAADNIIEYGDIEPPSLLERSLFNA